MQPPQGPQWQPPYGPPPQYPPYQQPQWQQSPQGYPQPLYSPKPPKKKRIGLWITLGIIAFVLFSCGVFATGFHDTTPKTSPSPTVASTQAVAPVPTHMPTSTAARPATPTTVARPPTATTVANAGPAVLGGTLDAFIARFGQPDSQTSNLISHFMRCGNSNTDQIIVFQFPTATSRVISVTAQSCTPWTMSQAVAACTLFFPADAVYKSSVPIPSNQGTFPALDKIYYSRTLAREFTPNNFTDANQNNVQPGLFDVQYLYTGTDMSHVDSCDVQLGTQQTKN